MSYNLRDSALKAIAALPNGAASIVSAPIALNNSAKGDFVAQCEFQVSAPALTTGQLPDGNTLTYDVLLSANADMSAPVTHIAAAIVQTGAGGAGAVAATFRFRLPSTIGAKSFVAVQATGVATVAASGASLTLEALL